MAKKRKIKQRRMDVTVGRGGLRVQPLEDDGRVVVTTSRGVEIECLPIADAIEAQEENARAGIEWPEVPTRTITDVAGSEMVKPLTEEYVEKSGQATEEQVEAWDEYRIALAGAEATFRERFNEGRVRLIAAKGVRWDAKLEETWIEEAEWMGMAVPEDPRERKLYFFRFEVMGNIGDLYTILFGIYRASGYDEEVLDEMEASFRTDMGQPDEEPDAGGDTGDPGQAGGAGLVGEPPVDGDGGGPEVGPDA